MTHLKKHTLIGDMKEIKRLMAIQQENNTMTHTPGPWRVYVREPRHMDGDLAQECTIEYAAGGIRSVLARLRDNELADEHGGTIFSNARLIAAAPALYEALKALYAVWGYKSDGYTPELSDQVEAAMALVEGKLDTVADE